MTADQVIDHIKALAPRERSKVAAFLQNETEAKLWTEEPPELLAAVDAGVSSLNSGHGKVVSQAELEQKVRRWATRGGSR